MNVTSTVITERHDRIAIIELNRPHVMNAMDMEMRVCLGEMLNVVARDPDVSIVVLAATGKSFCSGADLKAAAANPDKSVRRTARTLLHDIQPLIECITRMDKLVIAAVNGPAAGVGMSLALACDLMVMADSAVLVSPFINVGLVPDGGGSWFLVRRVGYGPALAAMLEAEKLTAARCLQLGIANRVVESIHLRAEALRWAAQLSSRAPLAVAATKRLARLALSNSLSDHMTIEAELQTTLASSGDSREAVAAFTQKRPAQFQGR